MEENFDIFDLPTDVFINPEKKNVSEFYQPSADKGRDGVYKALIRFLPNIHNPSLSKIMKYYVWLEDPTTNQGFSVDCPSTVGQKSILKDMFWKLKKSESVKDQELAEKFSRVETYYSLIQVIKDPNQPELEGKIMVYKFGSKINQKIEAQLKPEFGTPCNPFDLFEGKVFGLNIVKKMKWNNYDACEFVGDRTPLVLEGKPVQKVEEDMKKITTWLKENSTDISKYAYKEWDSETTEKVLNTIKKIVPDGRVVENIVTSAAGEGTKSANATTEPSTSFDNASTTSSNNNATDDFFSDSKTSDSNDDAKKGVSKIDDLYENL